MDEIELPSQECLSIAELNEYLERMYDCTRRTIKIMDNIENKVNEEADRVKKINSKMREASALIEELLVDIDRKLE